MKFVDTLVVFREVPDEITLAINISGCPVKCPGCHSSYLAQVIGTPLDKKSLRELIESYPGISCVSFMGGDSDPMFIRELALWVKDNYAGMKTSWYSGRDITHAKPILDALDYVKVGPYIDEFGPLDSPVTNQRFYAVKHAEDGQESTLTDLTFRFRKVII